MVVIQSIFRVVNCKELQPIVQLSQLMINSVNDVEWQPTYYQVEPVAEDVNSDTEDQVSIISISSEESLTSLSSISEVNPFISSDSSSTLVGSESDFDQFDSDITISDSERTETASESGMDDMPNNATEIIQNFQKFNSLPEVLNNIILFPQSGENFKFLNQLEPSASIWTHDCNCSFPTENQNIVKFYFQNCICPRMWPKFLMFYQPTMWVDNASASLLHFLIRNQGLSKFVNKLHFEIKNDPQVEFGLFLFKITERIQNNDCRYILSVHTDVFIRGTHFLKMHDLDVTDCSQTTYDHWLQLYDEDIDKYLEAVNQEHVIDLN